ncbi:uncharacterized protein [Ptychodera flava]|uniref:uncharacterized protein isoform X2 n=1 Tax=Ptychodera flava TaxID=63121 RepID=UPI00396A8297
MSQLNVTRQGSLPDLRETSDFVIDHETKEMLELRDEMLNLHLKPSYNSPRSAWSAGTSRQELDRIRLQTPQTPNVQPIKPQTPLTNGEVNHNVVKKVPKPPESPQNGLTITGRTLPLPPAKPQTNSHTRPIVTKPPKAPSPGLRGKSGEVNGC